MAEQPIIDPIRQNVLSFISKKKAELEAIKAQWLGWYHDGGHGVYPRREVFISMSGEKVHAVYTVNSQQWEYYFDLTELEFHPII